MFETSQNLKNRDFGAEKTLNFAWKHRFPSNFFPETHPAPIWSGLGAPRCGPKTTPPKIRNFRDFRALVKHLESVRGLQKSQKSRFRSGKTLICAWKNIFPSNVFPETYPAPIWSGLGAPRCGPKTTPPKIRNFSDFSVISTKIRRLTPVTGLSYCNYNGSPQNLTAPVLEMLTSDFALTTYTDPEFDGEFSNEHEIFIKNL